MKGNKSTSIRDGHSSFEQWVCDAVSEIDSERRRKIFETSLCNDLHNGFEELARNKLLLTFNEELPLVLPRGSKQIDRFNVVRQLHHDMLRVAALVQGTVAPSVDLKVIKGERISALYPKDLGRQYLDIDIYIKSLDEFWTLTRALLKVGARLIEIGLFKCPADGKIAGSAVFTIGSVLGLANPVYLDVLICSQQIFPGASWSVEEIDGAEYPNDVDLAFQVVEIADNERITVRDCIDLMTLLQAAGLPQRSAAFQLLNEIGMTDELHRILLTSQTIPRFRTFAQQMAAEFGFRGDPIISRNADFIARAWHQRTCARRATSIKGVANGLRSLQYEIALRLRSGGWWQQQIAQKIAAWMDPITMFDSGHLLRFYIRPLSPAARGDLSWMKSADKLWLRTPIAALVPAPFGLISSERLWQVSNAIRSQV